MLFFIFLSVLMMTGALVILIFLREQYAARQSAFASILRLSIDHQLPLSPMLNALAREQGVGFGEKVESIADEIEHGSPLADALGDHPRLLPRDLRLRIARPYADPRTAAGSVGDQASLTRMAESRRQLASTLVLIGAFTIVFSQINIFVAIKILPSFEKILKDFRLDSSFLRFTQLSLSLSLALILPGFLLCSYAFVVSSGWLRLPLESWLLPRLDPAAVLRALATAAERGVPFKRALEPMAAGFPSRRMSKRLHAAIDAIDFGAPWAESLRRCKLITPREEALFFAAERAGNLSSTLHETAASIERRAVERINAFNNLLGIGAVIVFGLGVLLVALPTFYTMIRVIRGAL